MDILINLKAHGCTTGVICVACRLLVRGNAAKFEMASLRVDEVNTLAAKCELQRGNFR